MGTRTIRDLQVVPALNLEPLGMFNDAALQSLDTAEVQALFRRAASGGLEKVRFIPGSEKLTSTPDLAPYLPEVARILTNDVAILADMEIAGGYAFLDRGQYAFGVEEDSALEDSIRWDDAISMLQSQGKATIQHAYERFFDAHLNPADQILSLQHSRTKDIYHVHFNSFADQVLRAKEFMRQFAVAIVPEFERHLHVSDPKRFAIENFRYHPEWFDIDPSKFRR